MSFAEDVLGSLETIPLFKESQHLQSVEVNKNKKGSHTETGVVEGDKSKFIGSFWEK